ncbi:phage tail tape measure protein [Streptomyces sp. BH097]|uniref:phage tail tape measure protein n=1 Tax=Streptomyces sp. BH097 TaxID=3410406 RepID=UPI003CF895AE
MALTVGELLATVGVDPSGMRSGLSQAENELRRSGTTMDGDAGRAGQQAGQSLGGGLRDRLSSSLKVGLAGVGIAAGGLLMQGFASALEQGQITGRLAAQLGATPAEAKKYGDIAGNMYANAVTEDFQGAADAISATMRAGIAPPDATNAQIESIATKVSDLSSTFELDLGQTANAVGQMLKTGLATNGTQAVDALTAGLQKMGPRADDIADTFNEYSTIFRNMGLDATTATGLLSQGMAAGARDTDVVADSLKEFLLITQKGGPEVDAAFKKIGLSGADMQAAFVKGGPTARAALDKVFDGLSKMKDGTDKNNTALTLFGTKSEDTQKALMALDPSKATEALGQVGGKAAEMGNSLRDNAGVRIETFKRQALQGLTEFIGGTVLPGLQTFFSFISDHKETFTAIAAVITAVVVPAIVALGVQSAITGARMAAAWVTAMGPIGWIGLAIGALVVLIVAYWDDIKKWTLAAWDWFVDKLVWAKDAAINAFMNWTLIGLIVKHWDSIRTKTVAAWNAVVDWVKGIPGRLYNAFLNWTLLGLIIKHWSSIKTATVNKAMEVVSWVRGLPGRISSAIGSLGSLLYSKGRDVVSGLWRGIKSMGSWLKSTLIGWAKALIPGPIAKALGIHSPSRVMARDVGRWIPAGVVKGIESGAGAVARTMQTLVPAPTMPGMATAGAYGAAGSPFASTQGGSMVHVEHWHAAENGSPEDNARELAWLAKARG